MRRFIRDAIFDTVYDLAAQDQDIILITADADAFGLRRFKKDFKERFFNVGVAEQAMVTVAAGMALAGKKVFVYAIAPFVTLRCLEQIKVNICMMDLPVFILGLGIGSAYGFDGPTHQSLFDVGIMMSIPKLSIYNPADYASAAYSVKRAVQNGRPAYIRIDRDSFEDLYDSAQNLEDGFRSIRNGSSKQLVITTGICSHYALESNVDCEIIDLFDLTGFNRRELAKKIQEHPNLIIYEEHWSKVGLAIAIFDVLSDYGLSPSIKRLGIPEDKCLSHDFGTRKWLHEQYGILPSNLKNEWRLKKKRIHVV